MNTRLSAYSSQLVVWNLLCLDSSNGAVRYVVSPSCPTKNPVGKNKHYRQHEKGSSSSLHVMQLHGLRTAAWLRAVLLAISCTLGIRLGNH